MGAALRGALGRALKSASCAAPGAACEDCARRADCAYSYLFETPRPADAAMMRKYPFVPHPFVLEPPLTNQRRWEPGEVFSFGVTLVGRGAERLEDVVSAMRRLEREGLGASAARFRLLDARPDDSEAHEGPGRLVRLDAEPTRRVELEFLSPTRIKADGRLVRRPAFRALVRALLSRVSALSAFHCGAELRVNFADMLAEAERVRLARSELSWARLARYSSRQRRRVDHSGFVGRAVYEGELTRFMPLLRLGEFTHVGKSASFGQGRYRIARRD